MELGQTHGLHRGSKEPPGLGRWALVLGQDGVLQMTEPLKKFKMNHIRVIYTSGH